MDNKIISHICPQKIRMEAHAKFAVLWHLTRDLHINKSSSFARSFDRLVTFYIQVFLRGREVEKSNFYCFARPKGPQGANALKIV